MVYIKDLKLTTAARKLLVSNTSINEIAYNIGYKDPNYFIREFKEAFGCTPRQYRVAAKEQYKCDVLFLSLKNKIIYKKTDILLDIFIKISVLFLFENMITKIKYI